MNTPSNKSNTRYILVWGQYAIVPHGRSGLSLEVTNELSWRYDSRYLFTDIDDARDALREILVDSRLSKHWQDIRIARVHRQPQVDVVYEYPKGSNVYDLDSDPAPDPAPAPDPVSAPVSAPAPAPDPDSAPAPEHSNDGASDTSHLRSFDDMYVVRKLYTRKPKIEYLYHSGGDFRKDYTCKWFEKFVHATPLKKSVADDIVEFLNSVDRDDGPDGPCVFDFLEYKDARIRSGVLSRAKDNK